MQYINYKLITLIGGQSLDAKMIRLNTEALVERYREGKLEFAECLRNICRIGGLHLLDDDMLNKGIIDIKWNK